MLKANITIPKYESQGSIVWSLNPPLGLGIWLGEDRYDHGQLSGSKYCCLYIKSSVMCRLSKNEAYCFECL